MERRVLFYLLLICSSCVQPKTSIEANSDTFMAEPLVKDSFVYYPIKDNRIKVDLNNPQKASLFDYFSHIELIPLETSDKVLIGGNVYDLKYHQNRYYIFDGMPQFTVQAFDEKGMFITKIGRMGQGPGEYPLIEDIYFNPFTGNIDLLNPFGIIYSYDYAGKHVKTTMRFAQPSLNEEELSAVHKLIALNEHTYVFYAQAHKYRIIYYDFKENRILHQEYEESRVGRYYQAKPFYEYNGQWYFCRIFNNEVYEVGPEALIKAYMWDFGKLNYNSFTVFPERAGYETDLMIELVRKLPYRMYAQGQNNRYVMAQIGLKNQIGSKEDAANLMYDKSTHECKLIEHFDESFMFRPWIVTNEYVLNWCSHGALERHISEVMLDETNRQKFKKLINTVGELNPVIIKYYFK